MKSIRKVSIILLIISVLSFVPNMLPIVNASTIGGAIEDADQFIQKGQDSAEGNPFLNAEGIYNVLNFIHSILLIAAITYAVIKGTMIGMKIILGTIEDRVDAKAMLVPYLWIVVAIAFGEVIIRAIINIIMNAVE